MEQGQTVVKSGQAGITASLTGKPEGTAVGQFCSSKAGGSVSGSSGNTQTVFLPLTPQEGAAYQLKVSCAGRLLCDRTVYFKEGRFRMLAKLGTKEKKKLPRAVLLQEAYGEPRIRNIRCIGMQAAAS